MRMAAARTRPTELINKRGSGGTTDSSESGKSLGRGATRGARLETFEMRMAAARTRPTELINKKGSGGTACKLTSNYFELVRQTNCSCTGSTLTRPSN